MPQENPWEYIISADSLFFCAQFSENSFDIVIFYNEYYTIFYNEYYTNLDSGSLSLQSDFSKFVQTQKVLLLPIVDELTEPNNVVGS